MLSLGGTDGDKSSYGKSARSSAMSSAYSHSRVPSLRTQLFTSKLRYETGVNTESDRSASFPSTRLIKRTIILLACSSVLLVFILLQDEDATSSIATGSLPTSIHKLASKLPVPKHKALHQVSATLAEGLSWPLTDFTLPCLYRLWQRRNTTMVCSIDSVKFKEGL